MSSRKTFQQLIASNKRNSWFLIAGMFLLLVTLGVVFGGAVLAYFATSEERTLPNFFVAVAGLMLLPTKKI